MIHEDDTRWMQRALEVGHAGVEAGQAPFGSVIVRQGEVLAEAYNTNARERDCTCHAEMNAVRRACRALDGPDLSGCEVYATCEPCPMCFAAIHWSNAARIVYAATIADAQAMGFRQLTVGVEQMKRDGGSPVKIVGPVLQDQGVALFKAWARRQGVTGTGGS